MSNPAYRAARSWAARRSSPDVRHALVTGADRAGWLQGLVTNDVLALRPGQGCYAAFLTPQGRMLADVHLLHLDSAFLLALPAAAEALIGRLERFIIMEDVAVADVSGRVACLSVHGPAAGSAVAAALSLGDRPRDALAALPEDHAVLVQDGSLVDIAQAAGALGSVAALVVATRECGVPGFLLCTSAAHATRLDAALAEANVPGLTGEEWTALRIEAGRPVFGADLTTDTIPLEAGLEDRAISFTKGCYVGQEVIVRVRDRGHGRVARHLVGLVAQDGARAAVAIDAGDTIRRGGRDTGRVTSAAWSPALGTWIALGYLGRDDAEPGTCVVIVREDGEVEAEVRALPLVRPQGHGESPGPEGPASASGHAMPQIVVTAAVIERDGAVLLTRRPEGTHLAGTWEFPGGKCEPGETLEESLRRELLEELGANAEIGDEVFACTHAYPTRTVTLHFFACRLRGEPHPRLGQQMQWVRRADLPGLSFPEADAELVAALAAGRLVLSASPEGPGSSQMP